MRHLFLALALALSVTALNSRAEAAFRCPNGNLVDTGDSIAVVTAKCDAPTSISKRSDPVETERGKIRYDEVQEWVYTANSTLVHILTFINGVLVSINTGGFAR